MKKVHVNWYFHLKRIWWGKKAFVLQELHDVVTTAEDDRSKTLRDQAHRQGGGDGCKCTPPPWAEMVCLERSKTPKMNLFFWFVNARSTSQCRKPTWGCWSLKTVFMILIYLPRPISSHNMITRKVQLVVHLLVTCFQKHWKCILR